MVVQCHIQIVKNAVSSHKGFAGQHFFRRAAIVTDGAFAAGIVQPAADGDCRGQTACAQQVMTAAVPRSAGYHRFRGGLHLLRERGQRVVLAQDANHRFSCTPFSHESGIDAADIPLHPEAGFFQIISLVF